MDRKFSTDGEMFDYDDAAEAMQALDDSGELEIGRAYYSTEFEPVDLAHYLDADAALETAQERLYDEIGEAAEDAYDASKEAIDELSNLMKAWAAKHFKDRGYWRAVGKTTEHHVTAEDIAKFRDGEESEG